MLDFAKKNIYEPITAEYQARAIIANSGPFKGTRMLNLSTRDELTNNIAVDEYDRDTADVKAKDRAETKGIDDNNIKTTREDEKFVKEDNDKQSDLLADPANLGGRHLYQDR